MYLFLDLVDDSRLIDTGEKAQMKSNISKGKRKN